MKAQDLVNLIDKLVEKKLNTKMKQLIREEVSSQVNKVMGKMLVEMVKESKQVQEPQQIESPIHTKDPRLNSVLAETVKRSQLQPRRSSLVDLMDGGFDKIGREVESAYTTTSDSKDSIQKIQSDGTNIGFMKSIVSEGATPVQQQSVLGTDVVPDVLKGVFNKNFKSVIQKMNEQKKYGSPGLINPSMVFSG